MMGVCSTSEPFFFNYSKADPNSSTDSKSAKLPKSVLSDGSSSSMCGELDVMCDESGSVVDKNTPIKQKKKKERGMRRVPPLFAFYL